MVERAWLPRHAFGRVPVPDTGTLARKVPPPSGQVTGRKSGAGDRWLWNRNDTALPE